jgi:hypothetical protein
MARLADRLSGWFAPGAETQVRQADPHAGETFARMTKTQITETARVLGLTEDEGGILHVRYTSRLHRASRTLDEGERTLALPSFLGRFERVAPRGAHLRP